MRRARQAMAGWYMATVLLISPAAGNTREALDAGAACSLLQKTIAKRDGMPESGPPEGWFCDIVPSKDPALFVIALRSGKPAPSGRLFGWFAVTRASGTVLGWDPEKQQAAPLRSQERAPATGR